MCASYLEHSKCRGLILSASLVILPVLNRQPSPSQNQSFFPGGENGRLAFLVCARPLGLSWEMEQKALPGHHPYKRQEQKAAIGLGPAGFPLKC